MTLTSIAYVGNDPAASNLKCNNRTGRHVDPTGINFSTTYGYDTRGNITGVTDGRNHTTAYAYDDSRRVYRVTEPTPTCGRTDIFYTGGLKTAVKRAKVCSPNVNNAAHWQTTTTSYTATDQIDLATDPDGNTTDTNYDDVDRPQDMIQSIDSGQTRTTRTKYDDAGQVSKIFKGFGSTDQITYAIYTYTPDGQTASVADAKSNLTNYLYDGYDRLWRSCFPGVADCSTPGTGLYEEYGYDDNGNLTTKRNRNGKTITTAYDDLNRESTRTVPANAAGNYARTLTTNYDLASRKWDITADGQTLGHRYDNAGRLNQVQDSLLNALGTNVGNVTYTYNAAGSRQTVTAYSLGTSWAPTYNYDEAERLDTITSGATTLADYSYDTLSRVGTLAYFDGTSTTYGYENDDDLASLTQAFTGGSLVYGFTHNGAHQIKTQTVSDNSYEFKPTAPGTTYTPNALNQYGNVGGITYVYDNNGNLTGDGTTAYEYDEENRLRKAGSSSYAYDPLGRRSSKTVSGTTTYFVSDGANEVMDLSSTGQRQRLYVNADGIDNRIAMYNDQAGTGWDLYHTNHQGSTVFTTRQGTGGMIAESFHYGPYGESDNATSGNPFRYTGRRFDSETGLYYYRARYYSSKIGRFLQADPVGYVSNLNMYQYVESDPTNKWDPSGQIDIFIGGFGDGTSKIVSEYSSRYAENSPSKTVQYFSWTNGKAVNALIDKQAAGEPINIIGHSYGAHTAAQVAARSNRAIDLLITADPVGKHDPGSFRSNVKTWINIIASPLKGNVSDVIANIGGKGGKLSGKADQSYSLDVNHGDFQSMMDTESPSGQSPVRILQNGGAGLSIGNNGNDSCESESCYPGGDTMPTGSAWPIFH